MSTNLGSPPAETVVEKDLIVGRPHLQLVTDELARLNVTYYPEQVEPSERLGLVLIKNLQGLPERAANTRAARGGQLEKIEAAAGRRLADLEMLLLDLRDCFEARFGGWAPEMDTNSHATTVVPAGPGMGRPMGVPGVNKTVRVGVLDTALIPCHPFLVGHLADPPHRLFDEVRPPDHGYLRPTSGHATFVASLIVNEAPNATIDLRTVLKGDPPSATAWEAAKGIASFIDADIDILNLSLSCRTFDGKPPLALAKAIQRLGGSVLVIAAAGNVDSSTSSKSPIWPAALPDVVAVGATDLSTDQSGDTLAPFSPRLPWVSVTAPGVDVFGAYFDTKEGAFANTAVKLTGGPTEFFGWAKWNGTSFAAATVTGKVAARVSSDVPARRALEELLSEDPSVRPYLHTS